MEDLEGEIWKPIIYKGVDYTGLYEISNYGNVIALKNNKIKIKGKPLRNGYITTWLSFKGERIQVSTHRLVITCFLGEISDNLVVDHINSIKTDNRLENLNLVTIRTNNSKEKAIISKTPTGVCFQKSKHKTYIVSRISIKLKDYTLGHYKTLGTAAEAYQISLSTHEQGKPLSEVFKAVDKYRESINLKPIKRRTL